MATTDYDVIVVGAGPGGSSSAGFLARAGARVLLLDRAQFPRSKACGEYTSPDSRAIYERLGALPAVLGAGAQAHNGMMIVAQSGARFTIEYKDQAGQPQPVFATDRANLDYALAHHAAASGADFQPATRLVTLLRDGERVAGVRLRGREGECNVTARWVVGADGVHSTVARLLEVEAPPPLRRLGLAAHYVGLKMGAVGEMHLLGGDYCALNPLAGGIVNVGPVVDLPAAGVVAAAGGIEAYFEAVCARFPGVREQLRGAERVGPVRGVGPMSSASKRQAGPGWLLVGDAAGFYDPFTGEGVHSALRGGELAAAVLAEALAEGWADARVQREYQQRRRRGFALKRKATELVQLFVRVPAAMNYIAPRLAKREPVRARLASAMGDLAPPSSILRPAFFWGLLRP